MNLEKHKTGVGIFVLSAIALLIAGIITLGGDKYFNADTEYVLYFSSSVNGISVGSPVMLRGVPLGSVTRISLMTNAGHSDVSTPVYIRINSSNLQLASGAHVTDENAEQEIIRTMISKGMRAQLQMSSLLTGQSRIQLDFYPDTRPNFLSANPLLEIPTIDSPIENLQKSLGRIPVEELLARMENSLLHLDQFLASGALDRTFASIEKTFNTATALLEDLRSAPKLLDTVLANLADSSGHLKKETPVTIAELRKALQDFDRASRQLNAFALAAEQLVAPDSPMSTNLNRLLRNGAEAARSLRNFADTLERNPESLLRGRQGAY